MSDYEIDFETPCPKCGHDRTHHRPCIGFCDDGWIDEYDDDPINYMPGEEERLCLECWGTGTEWWCPECGLNIQKYNYWKENEAVR